MDCAYRKGIGEVFQEVEEDFFDFLLACQLTSCLVLFETFVHEKEIDGVEEPNQNECVEGIVEVPESGDLGVFDSQIQNRSGGPEKDVA